MFMRVIIKTAAANLQGGAQFADPEAFFGLGAQSFGHPMALRDSWPKMAKAFFKMSRCLVMVRSSARNPATSSAGVTAWAPPAPAPCGHRDIALVVPSSYR